MASLSSMVRKLATVNLFARDDNTGQLKTGVFVGRPFYLDYDRAYLLIADAWKQRAKGIPQGTFLLAYYENELTVSEALLLRVLRPTRLPTDNSVISSMIEYYKDNLRTTGKDSQLDSFTRYEFSFSGLECRTLGTFYQDERGTPYFGADVENFYSAHNYSVLKPNNDVLETIVNFRDGQGSGKPTDIKIGHVRYSSSLRFQGNEDEVAVYVSPDDFLGKRTALFGMTRTGKSNTVKKIIQATCNMSDKAQYSLENSDLPLLSPEKNLDPFDAHGVPKFPVGQIIFDINGEYANANLQDEGTAIFEMFSERTVRYSTIQKDGFKVMKVNFYNAISSGFELIRSHLAEDRADYVRSFLAIELQEPVRENMDEQEYRRASIRYERLQAAYLCVLKAAGFPVPKGLRLKFQGRNELNQLARPEEPIDPSNGISLDEAIIWFTTIWDKYDTERFFSDYKKQKGYEWADEDLKAVLVFLTRKSKPSGNANISGFRKLRGILDLHTDTADKSFEVDIVSYLRSGKIVIVDLSQGNPAVQSLYSERICRYIFADAMSAFIQTKPNNFIQFYFEEAHNLFPKKDDKDLSQIYNRIAKEGAKLNLGLVYATQEVSSISSNILKNTQNWFIAHLNNEDETKEIKKFYDFGDFVDSLIRFSSNTDKGFVRMKTYSNPFVVPVQIDRFARENKD